MNTQEQVQHQVMLSSLSNGGSQMSSIRLDINCPVNGLDPIRFSQSTFFRQYLLDLKKSKSLKNNKELINVLSETPTFNYCCNNLESIISGTKEVRDFFSSYRNENIENKKNISSLIYQPTNGSIPITYFASKYVISHLKA